MHFNQVVRLLIEYEPHLVHLRWNGSTLLHHATEYGTETIMELVLDLGTVTDSVDVAGKTALLYACHKPDLLGPIKLLLDHGANPCFRPSNYEHSDITPLTYASSHGYENTVKLLLDYCAVIDFGPHSRFNPLHQAAKNGRDNIVKLLFCHGTDVDGEDYTGETPLGHAIIHGHESTVGLLLGCGADINRINIYECTPLHRAVRHGQEGIVLLLIRLGADVNILTVQGTPLALAARTVHSRIENIINVLLSYGAHW
jgi:ankyrin repeat protein